MAKITRRDTEIDVSAFGKVEVIEGIILQFTVNHSCAGQGYFLAAVGRKTDDLFLIGFNADGKSVNNVNSEGLPFVGVHKMIPSIVASIYINSVARV